MKLPIIVIIINNNGIYSGIGKSEWLALLDQKKQTGIMKIPSTALLPDAQYELLATAFGGHGTFVSTPSITLACADLSFIAQLRSAVQAAVQSRQPTVINCMIELTGVRKAQEHAWLSKKVESRL